MNIYFNEHGDFYFLRKDDVMKEFDSYAYHLASKDLGSEIIVLSKQDLNLAPLEKVNLSDLQVKDCTYVFKGNLQSLS